MPVLPTAGQKLQQYFPGFFFFFCISLISNFFKLTSRFLTKPWLAHTALDIQIKLKNIKDSVRTAQ